jgi:hypothetical protein
MRASLDILVRMSQVSYGIAAGLMRQTLDERIWFCISS